MKWSSFKTICWGFGGITTVTVFFGLSLMAKSAGPCLGAFPLLFMVSFAIFNTMKKTGYLSRSAGNVGIASAGFLNFQGFMITLDALIKDPNRDFFLGYYGVSFCLFGLLITLYVLYLVVQSMTSANVNGGMGAKSVMAGSVVLTGLCFSYVALTAPMQMIVTGGEPIINPYLCFIFLGLGILLGAFALIFGWRK